MHQGGLEQLKRTCEHCNKVYLAQKNLNRHMREVHENIRDHKCDICDQAFNRPVHLAEHKKVCSNP